MGRSDHVGWSCWAGTVSLDESVSGGIEAAVAARLDRLSLSPLDVAAAMKNGTTAADLRTRDP